MTLRIRLALLLLTLVLGSVATNLASILAGFGHGTYVPLALQCAPVVLIATSLAADNAFALTIFLSPLFWVGVLWLATAASARSRRIALALLVAQYISAAACIRWADEDIHRFTAMWSSWMAAFFVIYIAAQAALWWFALRRLEP